MRNHEQIVFDSGHGATVSLFFVDVAHIEESLSALFERLQKRLVALETATLLIFVGMIE